MDPCPPGGGAEVARVAGAAETGPGMPVGRVEVRKNDSWSVRVKGIGVRGRALECCFGQGWSTETVSGVRYSY